MTYFKLICSFTVIQIKDPKGYNIELDQDIEKFILRKSNSIKEQP